MSRRAASSLLLIPQDTVRIEVEFYDDDQRRKFESYPTFKEIARLVEEGVSVPTEEFLTYYLFHRKRSAKRGWQNYAEISQQVDVAAMHLQDWVRFDGHTIYTPEDIGRQEKDITEHIGESIGLSIVGRIHGLTAADWDRIEEKPGRRGVRTFDYETASDGKYIVQMEAKGTSLANTSRPSNAVANHKQQIEEKKITIRALEKLGTYPYAADLRYGVIGIVSSDRPARALLVDPPADENPQEASRVRILHRMRFLTNWISLISPRSQLAAALNTRLAALERLPDPFLLDGVPLRRGTGQAFEFTPTSWSGGIHSSFFTYKSRIADGPAGGITFQLSNGNFFFFGIRQTLLELAANQEFATLSEFKAEHGRIAKTVECVFTQRVFEGLRLPEELRNEARSDGTHVTLELEGRINYSDSGILFGELPINQG